MTARFDLPLGVVAPAAARHAARSILAGWGLTDERWLDDATVIVHELVANAVRHGGGRVSLDLHVREGLVIIGAADGSAIEPRRREPDNDGGRGLAIVEALAGRWGVDNYVAGKRVWVQLPRHP